MERETEEIYKLKYQQIIISEIRKEQRKTEKSEGNRLCEKRCQTNPN